MINFLLPFFIFLFNIGPSFQTTYRCLGPCLCSEDGLTVECSDGDLENVPYGIPESTVYLDLSNNKIKEITECDFNYLENLSTLDLSRNDITVLHEFAFTNNSQLKKLDLSFNYVNLASGTFKGGNSSIEDLNLSYNLLNQLLNRPFAGLNNLLRFGLAGNIFSSLQTQAFSGLDVIQELDLSYNYFSTSPLDALNFIGATLESLDLSYNNRMNIVKEEEDIFNLPKLTNISLIYCGFSTLANNSFQGMQNLKILDLSYNSFLVLLQPETFAGLDDLRELYISYTRLLTFPHFAFSPISATLQVLEFNNNFLSAILPNPLKGPEYFGRLEQLSMERNNINFISDDFFINMANLTSLKLSHTLLLEFPYDAISPLLNLRALYYDGNYITSLNATTLPPLPNLQDIFIRQTSSFTEITASAFSKFGETLKFVNISENNINTIDSAAFQNLSALTQISIAQNQLSTALPEWFAGLSLDTITLNGNPWSCDCEMLDYQHWMKSVEYEEITNAEDVKCHYPRSIRGTGLLYVEDLTCEAQPCPDECICLEAPVKYSYYDSFDIKTAWRNSFKNGTISLFYGAPKSLRKSQYSSSYTLVDCSYEGLDYVPQLPPNVLYAYFSSNLIPILQPENFGSLGNTIEINLHDNDIRNITAGSFANTTNLLKLDLSDNSLSRINANYFNSLHSLQELRLDFNSIEWIDEDSFSNLLQLKVLELSSNNIQTIGKMFHNLTSLQYLGLSDNYLVGSIAPDAFRNLPNLWGASMYSAGITHIERDWFVMNEDMEILNIGGNQFTNLSSEFLVSSSLITLYAEYGKIKHIDNLAFAMLPNLRTLRTQGNHIETIKYDSFKLNESFSETGESNIISLDLAYNNMEKIPVDSFWHLSSLQLLRLDNNLFTELPVASDCAYDYNHELDSYMPYLTTVYLSHTEISEIPSDSFMMRLFYIETLEISYCQFTELPYYFLQHSDKLVTLIANGNKLTDISTEFPESLSNLKILEIGDTGSLERISNVTFQNTVNLQRLILSNGNLSYIPLDAFSKLSNLELLDISRNKLLTPYKEWFSGFQTDNLQIVHMGDNDWVCSCDVNDYRLWVKGGCDGLSAYTMDIVCDSPQNTKSWRISELEDSNVDKECGFNSSTSSTFPDTTTPSTPSSTTTQTSTTSTIKLTSVSASFVTTNRPETTSSCALLASNITNLLICNIIVIYLRIY